VGFIADWDSSSQVVSNFTELIYSPICNAPSLTGTCSAASTSNAMSAHVEGITTDGAGGYNLSADVAYVGKPGAGVTDPAFVNIKRTGALGTAFAVPAWTLAGYYPGSSWTSANTVYQNNLMGLYQTTVGSVVTNDSYVATIPGI
jgi:hypothetical protein